MIELAALPTSLPLALGRSHRARVTLESGRSAGHRWVRTVGLGQLGLPELVVSGLSPAVARSLLAPLVAELPAAAGNGLVAASTWAGFPSVWSRWSGPR
ncbi:MAG: hypothetical protein R2705_12055 [Ilumatobacteraceae bacterium]